MQAHDPVTFAARRKDRWNVTAPKGETYAEVATRMRAWLQELTSDTVAVAHGGTMRALMVATGVASTLEAIEAQVEQGVVAGGRAAGCANTDAVAFAPAKTGLVVTDVTLNSGGMEQRRGGPVVDAFYGSSRPVYGGCRSVSDAAGRIQNQLTRPRFASHLFVALYQMTIGNCGA